MNELETIRDILKASLEADTIGQGQTHDVTRALDENAQPIDYVLRFAADFGVEEVGDVLRERLLNSSYLYVPEVLFKGFKCGQALAEVSTKGLVHAPDGFNILPLHQGQSLKEYLYTKDELNESDFPNRFDNPITRRREALGKHMLAHPEQVKELFLQAAYIGLHTFGQAPDRTGSNIMVGDDLSLSLVDIAQPRKLPGELDPDYQSSSNAERMITRDYNKEEEWSLYSGLCNTLLSSPTRHAKPHEAALRQLLKEAHDNALKHIQAEDWQSIRPEWNGSLFSRTVIEDIAKQANAEAIALTGEPVFAFDTVKQTQAIRMDAPAATLKIALDALYNQAVPEQAR